MKKLLLLAVGLTLTLFSYSQLDSIGFEAVVVHDNTEYMDAFYNNNEPYTLEGYTTWVLYAYCANEDDFVTSVYGDLQNPLLISALDDDCSPEALFYQSSLATSVSAPINPSLTDIYPGYAFDSFVTLGMLLTTDHPDAGPTNPIESAEDQWFGEFGTDGDSLAMDSNVGGAWFTTLADANVNGYAGSDLKVSLGQFTTPCELEALMNVQVFTNGLQPTAENPYQDVYLGVYANTTGELAGCTDPEALNYDDQATADDGSCVYPCTLVIDSITVTDVACNGFSSGSLEVHTSGEQGLVLHTVECGEPGIASNNINGLAAGDYTVCVEDSQGCEATMDVTINEPSAFEVTLESTTFPVVWRIWYRWRFTGHGF